MDHRAIAGDAGDPAEVDTEVAEVLPSRVVLSLWVAGIVIVMVCGTFSDTGVQATLKAATQPIRTITGLNQHWDVFAPNLRMNSTYIDGRVDFSDGTSKIYGITTRRGLGAYSDYRWQKFEESIRPDTASALWPAYAEYLVGRARAEGRSPVRISLIRRSAETLPPGPGPQRRPWTESTIFVMDLRG